MDYKTNLNSRKSFYDSESRSVVSDSSWSLGLYSPWNSPGDLPNPGIKPTSPALQADSLPAEPQGKFILWQEITDLILTLIALSNSVQFSRSVVSDSLQPHELQHARPPCPSPTLIYLPFTLNHKVPLCRKPCSNKDPAIAFLSWMFLILKLLIYQAPKPLKQLQNDPWWPKNFTAVTQNSPHSLKPDF